MISLLIVNYNTKDYLIKCLESIYKSGTSLTHFQIIIVDNASKDSSVEKIAKEYSLEIENKQIEIVRNDRNLGFSKAVNIGLKKCRGNYICILNPDIYIEKECLNILRKYMDKNPEVGCITPKIVNSNGSLQISCKRSLPTIQNSIYKIFAIDRFFPNNRNISSYNLLYLKEDEVNQVEVISGAFMFLRLETVKAVGFFDEIFYLYGEDIDYCHRINKIGFKIIYYPLAKVIHYKGKSAKSHPFRVISEFHNSMIKYYAKYQDDYTGWKFFKVFIVISVIIKKYLAYFLLLIKKMFRQI